MTKQLIYLLAFICFIQVNSSAKPPTCPGSGCEKKVCTTRPAESKKTAPRAKKTAAAARPLNFYLFNF